MKKGWIYFIVISTVVLLSLAIVFISRVKSFENNEPLKAIPTNASVIIEVNSINALAQAIFEDAEFKDELLASEMLRVPLSKVTYMDSLFIDNPEIISMLKKRALLVSLHAIGKDKVKMLFVSDVKNKREESELIELFEGLGSLGFKLSQRVYNATAIYTISHSDHTFYIALYQGVLIGSSTHLLVEASIRQLKMDSGLGDENAFKMIKKTSGDQSVLNVYFNFQDLQNVLLPISNSSKGVKTIANQANWGELDVDIDSESISMNGFFSRNDQGIYSYLFHDCKPIRSDVEEVLPSNTRAFVSYNFSDSKLYIERLKQYLSKNNQLSEFESSLNQLNKEAGVDMEALYADHCTGSFTVAYMDYNKLSPAQNGVLVLPIKSQSKCREAIGVDIENRIVKNYQVDKDVSFNIYRGFSNGVVKHFLGPVLTHVPQKYFSFYENHLFFSNSLKQLEQFIYANVLNKTLDNKKIYIEFREGFASRENLFAYCESGQLPNLANNFFGPLFANLTTKQLDYLDNFYAFGLQLSGVGDLVYATAHTNYAPVREHEPLTVWQSLLDTVAITKPALVKNHYSKEKEVLVQDANFNLYLLGNNGRVLWKKPIDGPIKSEVIQIDIYRNNKLQYLFNTSDKVYLLDRNGNHVNYFPISLPSKATNGVACFDYDQSRKYRFVIACENRKVYMFNDKGNRVTGWSTPKTEGIVTLPLQHFRSGDKDYVTLLDDVKCYILNRQGKERVKLNQSFVPNTNSPLFIQKENTRDASLVTTASNGNLIKISLKSGDVETMPFVEEGTKHGFNTFASLKSGLLNYVVTYSNSITVFSHQQKKLFSKTFEDEIMAVSDVYQFSSNNFKIGVVEANNGNIHLLNSDGEEYKGFPLRGQSRFSIGFLSRSSSQFNLIVAGSNNYLYNYQVE